MEVAERRHDILDLHRVLPTRSKSLYKDQYRESLGKLERPTVRQFKPSSVRCTIERHKYFFSLLVDEHRMTTQELVQIL